MNSYYINLIIYLNIFCFLSAFPGAEKATAKRQ